MVILAHLKDVDVGEVILIKRWEKIRSLKREYIKMGFIHQIAMYGVLKNNETDESYYKRIDVLSDTVWTEDSFTRVYEFMAFIKNPAKYSIWLYSDSTKEAVEVIWFS